MVEDWEDGEEAVPQRPAAAVDEGAWDVIVVGAGPAGALAARRLALGGRRVLLLDRRRFPRDKTCGDALIPDALAVLADEGLLPQVRALAWRGDAHDLYAPSRTRVSVDCEILTVPRRRLDARLACEAVAAGATFAHGAVDAVEESDAGVRVRVSGRTAPLEARHVLLATGAHVRLLGATGLLARPAASAVAVRTYLTSRHRLDRMVVSFDRAVLPGYAWIFPVATGARGTTYNVGTGIVLAGGAGDDDAAAARALRPMLERFLGGFPEARALAAAEVSRTPVRGALLRCGLSGARAWSGGRVLAAGEAIGTTFPLTGEGIGKAMQTGLLAADALDAALAAADADARQAALAAYPHAVERLRATYRGYAAAERWMGRPWLADLVFRGAARSPRARALLTGVLEERVDPSRLFSPRGVLRLLTGTLTGSAARA